MTVAQVARRHFQAQNTAANRLAALAHAGYVRVERPHYHGQAAYLTTSLGARVAGVGLPVARFSPSGARHQLAVVDLADVLLRDHADAHWIAERELRRDGMQTVRDRRRGYLLSGTPHVPDGVLVLPAGPPGGLAVELELSAKKQAEYERIFHWYAGVGDYRQVIWFAADATLEKRLAALIADERMDDFMRVQPVPAGVIIERWG